MTHLQQSCKATSLSNGKKSVQNSRQYRVSSENEDVPDILPALLAPLSDGVNDILIFDISVDKDVSRMEDNEDSDDLSEDSNESEELIDVTNPFNYTADQLQMLRTYWSSCSSKRIAKQNLRACYNAFRRVCSEYSCTSDLKRTIRLECKRSCQVQGHSSFYYYDYEPYWVIG